ncbi:secreted protein [Kutzneria sp. 744]|nr:secreted protein [Kutzneria sp. 744]
MSGTCHAKCVDRGGNMSRRSLVAVTTVGALIAGLLVPATASADTQPQATDRARVVMLWQVSGQLVRSAAEQALVGSDADVHTFLTSGYQHAAELDERITVDRMLADGGVATKTAAQQALDATDPGAIRQFLDTGWDTPRQTDLRVQVDQRLAQGGTETRKAAQAALDAGTVDALQQFLATGWRNPWQTDQRIRINQILSGGGSEVRKSAQVALDTGTVDAYVQFLDQDLPVAQARDQETQTVAQLASVAQDAGDEAARETQAAMDAAPGPRARMCHHLG